MLKLSLLPDEYLTINGDIVVQLTRVAGGRAYLAVNADRSVPVVRGTVLERDGGKRPGCLTPASGKKTKYHRDHFFAWNDDRERAVRAMRQVMNRLEENGAGEEAAVLRRQLDRIIPPLWEEEVTGPAALTK